ncbi:MAG: hypothetical protein ABSC33_20595, partial [Candidatus Sulfotelmatobacter sp.]
FYEAPAISTIEQGAIIELDYPPRKSEHPMRNSECQDTNLATLDRALIENTFAIESKLPDDAVEHVPTYSGAVPKVPYNQ